MGTTTYLKRESLVTFSLKVEGNAVSEDIEVQSILVDQAVNGIGTTKIVIGNNRQGMDNSKLGPSDIFIPGKLMSIEAGYDSKQSLLFHGIITKQSVCINGTVGSVLEIECCDKAVSMCVVRNNVIFSKEKDSTIINSIIGSYPNLRSKVTSTATESENQIQYHTTDWDFILCRAQANKLVVTALNSIIAVFSPDQDTVSVLEIKYGENLFELKVGLDAVAPLEIVKSNANDFSIKKNISGEVKFQGSSLVSPGKYITITGVGKHFEGKHFVSEVKHSISNGNWITEATIGLASVLFTDKVGRFTNSASNRLAGPQGVFNGIVKEIQDHPDGESRVLVDLSAFDSDKNSILARLIHTYSTSESEAIVLPEIGDKVGVVFLNEDSIDPIIIGSVYNNSKLNPAIYEGVVNKNVKKAMASKTGIIVDVDNDNNVYTIKTPASNTVVLSDKDKSITLKDENNNSIVMSSDGITIRSEKKIILEANQNVEIKGETGVNVEATEGDVEIKGMNIKETAEMEYRVRGNVVATVEGGGQLTLKGAMVMIN